MGWNSLYWDNHDQPRAVSRFGDDSPGAPGRLGQDAGDGAAPAPRHAVRLPGRGARDDEHATSPSIDQYHDIESVNYHREAIEARCATPRPCSPSLAAKGRDNARTPMHWDDSEHAGFTTGEPWLPAHPTRTTINAAAAVADPDSVFHHFRRLIALRHDAPGRRRRRLRAAAARPRAAVGVHPDPRRTTSGWSLANCSSEPAKVEADDVPDLGAAEAAARDARRGRARAGARGSPGSTRCDGPRVDWPFVSSGRCLAS